MYLFMYSSRPGATIIQFKLLVPSDCDCFPPAGGRRLSELLANAWKLPPSSTRCFLSHVGALSPPTGRVLATICSNQEL